jgi:hypothetical protein
MKGEHIMSITKQRLVATAATAAIALVVPITAFAGYFPADRPTYTCATPTSCKGADHVVFDSFTNNPVVGDERPFLAGSVGGANVQDTVNVKDGDIVTLRAYVHNNADPSLIGIPAATAHNVRIHVALPTVTQQNQGVVAFISASNANPGTINDTMQLTGAQAFSVQYVPGSAVFQHKADGVNLVNQSISDNIVGPNGTFLGDVHGCFDFSGYVTIKVKVHMPTTPVPPKPPVTPSVTPSVTPTVTPTALPQTGPEGALAGMAGTGALGYGVMAYRRSKQALADKLLNRK